MNYRFVTSGGCGPEIWIQSPFNEKPGIEKYGTGAGALPLIGGHHKYHVMLEEKLSDFFFARQVHLHLHHRLYRKQRYIAGVTQIARLCDSRYGGTCQCI